MTTKNQLGFSVLHVLPALAIVAVIAVIGYSIKQHSSASVTGYISCSTSWQLRSSDVLATTTVTNHLGYSLSSYELRYLKNGVINRYYTLGSLGNGASRTSRYSVPRDYTPKFTYQAQISSRLGKSGCGSKVFYPAI